MYNSNFSLNFILKQRQGKGLSETEVINLLQHILPQLEQLHNQGKTQGNISLDSLFLSNNQVLLQINDSNYNNDYSKDIYDLGIVLIELLTAKNLNQILNLSGETWDDYCTISDQLLNTINKMIAPPYERFNSVREISVALNLLNSPNIAPTQLSNNYSQNYNINYSNNQPIITQKKNFTWLWISLTLLAIIGMLTAIILPNFIAKRNKIQRFEAQTNINEIIKAQVSSYVKNGKFNNSFQDLGLGFSSESKSYDYQVQLLDENRVIAIAIPKHKGLRSIIGVTFVNSDNIIDAVCVSKNNSLQAPIIPNLTDSNFQCSDDSELLSNTNSTPVPDQFIPRPSPEQAIINYYDTLNQDNYQDGWYSLSPELRNNFTLHPKGFDSYLEWWTQVAYVNVLNTRLINQTPYNSVIVTDLRYRLQF